MTHVPSGTPGVFTSDRGPPIQLCSGKMFYLLDPRPDDIEIEDIATALAKINRYTGHTIEPISVAQHSVMVSKIVPREDALWGLLHDAAEAYVGDISRPLKHAMKGAIATVEMPILRAVAVHFGLPEKMPASVKHADNVALATEKRDLMPAGEEWPGMPDPLPGIIRPWSWRVAERRFLQRFEELTA